MARNPSRASQCARHNAPTCTGVLASVHKLCTDTPTPRQENAALISHRLGGVGGEGVENPSPLLESFLKESELEACLPLYGKASQREPCSQGLLPYSLSKPGKTLRERELLSGK